MKVFADTSGLFAALVRNDVLHVKAKATMQQLLDERATIFITSYVLLETMALLQTRVSLEAARQFERILRPLLRVVWVDQSLHERAFRRLELRKTRKLSLVDCASFIAMEQEGIETAFCYDEHFAKEGYRIAAEPEDLHS